MQRFTVLCAAALAAALSLPALADVQPLVIDAPQAQLTMAQAVVIAESMGNGRATRARLDERAATPVYRITVQAQGQDPLQLQVATRGGRIVASERKDRHD